MASDIRRQVPASALAYGPSVEVFGLADQVKVLARELSELPDPLDADMVSAVQRLLEFI